MIRPAKNYLLVMPFKKEKKETIILPKEKDPKMWKIVEMGMKDSEFAKNDIVILQTYHNGTIIEDEDVEYTIVKEEHVLAVVR